MARIGVLVNPDAGLGGKLGFKGSDGRAEEARKSGAKDRAGPRMRETLTNIFELIKLGRCAEFELIICGGKMGSDWIKDIKFQEKKIVGEWNGKTTSEDTHKAVELILEENIDLLLYAGGDGTTRDIVEKLESLNASNTPLIGVPSGVKMYSGCFAEDTNAAAEVLVAWINGELGFSTTEVLDMDEESYRKGEWKIDMFGQAITPASPLWIQGSKHQIQAIGEEEIIESLSEHISELYIQNKNNLIIWGAGGSLNQIAKHCGLNTTLLGIDISKGNQLIGADLSENEIIKILENNENDEFILLLSPMGGQGFLIGRGNLQLSPRVLRKIGIGNIMGVATPAKLLSISRIRIDTGDSLLDEEIRGKKYIKMIQGYRTIKIVKIDSPNN
ncbi:MAG: NAD(+)/NADH kinase [Candidatus Thermoplasmatota archaeon]|nr:NAD(+)/NADH kinase [Candidatus Thermoplasmatota archaeon]